jgi:hypothetical protein
VLRSRYIDITLRGCASPEGQGAADPSSLAPGPLHLPWTPTSASARKGIAWEPSAQANLDPVTSDILLTAIARARSWMNVKLGSAQAEASCQKSPLGRESNCRTAANR